MKLSLLCSALLLATSAYGTQIRLANGGANYGRIEVLHSGLWGTVCDDYFDMNNNGAKVVCRMLGLGTVGAVYNYYGAGSGQVWLDNVRCLGNETDIDDCPHNPWGNENCVHSEDAGVHCDPAVTTTPEPCFVPCSGNGDHSCTCHRGFTGDDCSIVIDFCESLVSELTGEPGAVGNMSTACRPHGYCVSSHQGASCVCDDGWSGPFCATENQTAIWIGGRCLLRASDQYLHSGYPVGCEVLQGEPEEHCVPDDLDCFYDMDCRDPIGWCLPMPQRNYDRLVEATKALAIKEKAFRHA